MKKLSQKSWGWIFAVMLIVGFLSMGYLGNIASLIETVGVLGLIVVFFNIRSEKKDKKVKENEK